MSKLPNGWCKAKLDQVAMIEMGQSPDSRTYNTEGNGLPFFQGKAEFQDTYPEIRKWCSAPTKVVEQGDILLSIRAPVGPTNLAPKKSCIGRGLAGIRAKGGLNQLYIYYFLKSIEIWLSEQGTGSTFAAISGQFVRGIAVPVAPAAEQTRIVFKLEELLSGLDAGVAELKVAQRKLKQYRQSLLKAAIEGALTAPWREAQRKQDVPTETGTQLLKRILTERRDRWEAKQLAKFTERGKTPPKDWEKKYPEPVRPDTTDLPALPKGWAWASVDQCSLDEHAITDGPFGSNLKSEHYQDRGPRVIRLQNIGDGIFIDAYAHISEAHFANLAKHAIETGDVAVAMLGEVLPRACSIPEGVAPAIVKADCARVRLNNELMRGAILVAQLNSKPVRDATMKFVKGIGRPRINLGHVRAIPIALAPSEEQAAAETILQEVQLSITEQLTAIELSLMRSVAQRRNILRAAFAGQLVPQDPRDESASVLLERIRAEQAERAKLPKARKSKQPKEIAAVMSKLIEVLAEAGDWVPAQEAFRRCGVVNGALTDRIEELYAELRQLDKGGRLASEPVFELDKKTGRKVKTGDRLKLVVR